MRNRPIGMKKAVSSLTAAMCLTVSLASGFAQTGVSPALARQQAAPQASQSAPLTLTLQDALALAQKNDPIPGGSGRSRGLRRGSSPGAGIPVSFAERKSEYLGTQGNGKLAESRFVTNDGVHVYREWAVVHQDFSPAMFAGTGRRSRRSGRSGRASQGRSCAPGPGARRHESYYALIVAQRKYATAQQALDQAQRSSQSARIWSAAARSGAQRRR